MHEEGTRVVLFSGGGTGGHLYPALALADALRELRPDLRAVFVGARGGLEARVLPRREEEHVLLAVRGIPRGEGLGRKLGALLPLGRAVAQAVSVLRGHRPEVVVVTGGYAGGPAGLAAVLLGVPLVLQEQNAQPGLVTRVLSRWAEQVHLAYPEARSRLPRRARARARISGNPVRPPAIRERDPARISLGLRPVGRVLLVVGGSQGSAALNRAVTRAVVELLAGRLSRPRDLQLLWATGPDNVDRVREELGGRLGIPRWIRVTGYIDDMPAALVASDLAVSRAGAMATSEFLAAGLPAVLVPLPTAAADHQSRNAEALEDAGAAVHLPETALTGEALWQKVTAILERPDRLEKMSASARARGRPDAAREIALEIASLLGEQP